MSISCPSHTSKEPWTRHQLSRSIGPYLPQASARGLLRLRCARHDRAGERTGRFIGIYNPFEVSKMSRTAADFLAETLQRAGVKRVYGVVGDSLNGFTDALRRLKSIEWMHMRHEEGAAFAAGAEAHLTGELAVCAGSCGPGNLHLINGLYDCHRSGVPVLAIAAHIPSTEIGIDYFQATHPETLFKDCSHYVELVSIPISFLRY